LAAAVAAKGVTFVLQTCGPKALIPTIRPQLDFSKCGIAGVANSKKLLEIVACAFSNSSSETLIMGVFKA
jgi:hypothetical protein